MNKLSLVNLYRRIYNYFFNKCPKDKVQCPYCWTPMPEGTLYDGWVYCPKCGGKFDIHE
ncbi:hypothetical protein KAR91_60750 [Candidatus Pacearchaeota archaeon]|nr:hypothetical protein [Candidatus Pacearchaeota archaeon]